MAFEIVDGMTGTKHISSDDLSALNIATVGKADCVLDYGDNFALTMVNSNTATLGTGVGMVGGKRFWNQAATSLTIQSGTQGQKRNDLVVARYAKTSAGIESITPVVIKGTPTTGTATDPDVTANDLKLWRIPLDGINAGTPVKLFDAVSPLSTIAAETKKLGDSVSRPLFKTVKYTSPKTDVGSGNVLEYNGTLKNIKGYTPVGIVETNTNHDWSFGLMRATLNGDGTFTCTWMNFNKNTWRGSIGYATVLYIRS